MVRTVGHVTWNAIAKILGAPLVFEVDIPKRLRTGWPVSACEWRPVDKYKSLAVIDGRAMVARIECQKCAVLVDLAFEITARRLP